MLEASLGRRSTPTLTSLAEHGRLGRATTTFPSLTPVCLSSIATGAHPDVHEIPHLVWWHRGERRIVEYGSSFGAVRAAGIGRTLRDTLVGLNADHLGRRAVTIFEALADAGVRTAAVNFTVYRGRTPHRSTVPFLGTVLGPERFFFYNLFQSERSAGLSFRNRAAGTVDAYAAAVGRWLVTRDGFDFLLLYLSDYDYASHAAGPDAATDVLARCDEAVGGLVRAAGGLDEFLTRYAILVVSTTASRRCTTSRGSGIASATRRRRSCSRRIGRGTWSGRGRARRARGRSPSGSTASRRRRSSCFARTGRSSPVATARSSVRPGRPHAARGRPGDPRPARRRGARGGGARVPERRRGRRLRRRGLGVRGPRREPPPRRRVARLAARRGLARPRAGGGARRGSSGPDRRPRTGRARPLRGRRAGVRRPLGGVSDPAAAEWGRLRGRMVERQLRRRGITDERVLSAMERVPREAFVPPELAAVAYDDAALPIGEGQTISQPFIVAAMCELLALEGTERVLEVGTGSGYAAAVLDELARGVVSVERIPGLAARARRALDLTGHADVEVRVADDVLGAPDRAPFDAISVAAATDRTPQGPVRPARRRRAAGPADRWSRGSASSASSDRHGGPSRPSPSPAGSSPWSR